MKILILANSDIGLFNFRKELLQRLFLDGHSIIIALPGGDRVVKMIKMGCSYYQIDIDRRGMNPFKDILLLKAYFCLIKKVNPDVVLTFTIKPNIYGGLVCRLLKKKYITNITGLGTAIEKGGTTAKLILALYTVAIKKAVCIFFQNKSNMKHVIKQDTHILKGKLISGSGVNLKEHRFEEYPLEEDTIVLLFIGRIMKEKGIDELLKAAINIKKNFPAVVFKLVGSCEEDYRQKLNSLEKKGIIQYLGFQSEVHSIIVESSVVLLPSYHEGLSNVLLEASATGRPVLASRISGCSECFEEGITGLGFEVKNASSLEKAIIRFLKLPYEMRKEMGKSARKKVEIEFDRNSIVNAYLKEINDINIKETGNEAV